jgi:hypothetical protein
MLLVLFADMADLAYAIDVAQDHMATESLVGAQRAFQVDRLSDAERAQGRARESFRYRLDGKAVRVDVDCGLTGSVDIDAIPCLQVGKHALCGDFQSLEIALTLAAAHPPYFFYESGEHEY